MDVSGANIDVRRGISGINLRHLLIVIICLIFLISPLGGFIYIKSRGLYSACVEHTACSSMDEFRVFIASAWGGLISLAATSGFLGTILSFFLRQTNKDYINTGIAQDEKIFVFIGVREILVLSFFGIMFGLIMLSMFLGEFLGGNLFPKIQASSWISLSIRVDGWAKVFIWCFLAGFSERLIPNLLDNLVRRVPSADPHLDAYQAAAPKIEG